MDFSSLIKQNEPVQQISNPCLFYLEEKKIDGIFSYYDKERQENITTTLPFFFVPFDIYWSAAGWIIKPSRKGKTEKNKRVLCTEVKNLQTEELSVFLFDEEKKKIDLRTDFWANLKKQNEWQLRPCQHIYGAAYMTPHGTLVNASGDGEEYAANLGIVRIKLSGTWLSNWLNNQTAYGIKDSALIIEQGELVEVQAGKEVITYYETNFSRKPLSPEVNKQVSALYQTWLDYKNPKKDIIVDSAEDLALNDLLDENEELNDKQCPF